ncbi:MAG: FkbM family methyltransferase [Alphaproteobacteria bacterium]|nr:FkbM family methyltransferase [Alphaproteobacteria bacterium]
MPAKSVLDRVGTVIKEPVVFKVEEFGGTFSINPRSHLLHRILNDGFYEPRISSLFFASIDPQRDILDIGANIGFFTVGGAKRLTTGRLLAAEPTREAFGQLSSNVARNGVADRVILFKGLIGSTSGQAEIRSVPGLEEYSSTREIQHFATREMETITENVPIDTIDNLVERNNLRPALMKVDVEGAEYHVFEGAKQTLAKHRPTVISELWHKSENAGGHTGQELVDMFRKLDYVVVDPHDPLSQPSLHEIGEMFCVPKERFSPRLLDER